MALGAVTAVGPVTIAGLVNSQSNAPASQTFGDIVGTKVGTNAGLVLDNYYAGAPANGVALQGAAGNVDAGTIVVQVADAWTICVVTRASGTQHCISYKFPLVAATWTNATATSSANANSSAPTSTYFGGRGAGTEFQGWVAVGAIWNVVLTATQVHNLSTNLATADWLNKTLVGTRPQALWELNQTTMSARLSWTCLVGTLTRQLLLVLP